MLCFTWLCSQCQGPAYVRNCCFGEPERRYGNRGNAEAGFVLNPFRENHTDIGARADSEYVFTDAA
jgi:hypothetical protein